MSATHFVPSLFVRVILTVSPLDFPRRLRLSRLLNRRPPTRRLRKSMHVSSQFPVASACCCRHALMPCILLCRELDKQVESGRLALAAEKRALADIQTAKRARKTVEGFKAEQDAIDADRAKADALKKELDDPEAVAMSQKYDAIKAELDQLRSAGDEAHAQRNKLFDEMRAAKTEVDDLWAKKKEATKQNREANDRYYKKVAEDRARRQERYATERAAAELEKRKEVAERLREEASVPAYQAEIEDCQTLIDTLGAKIGIGGTISTPALNLAASESSPIAGVPKLEVRTIEAPTDLVARKKKGDNEENYFVASKKKKAAPTNGKATATAAAPTEETSTPAADTKLNLPYSTLSALLQLSIPPPTSTSDIPRAIEDLKTKKAWFEANQARVTKENIAKADAEIKRLEAASAKMSGEDPAEPVPTPAAANGAKSEPVAAEPVESKLEEVQEEQTVAEDA
ncbi:hypothetical protein DL93DRAFT_2117769 [Clavulina sp. PMI_390]|nr:hypothetical protein DL93DRAFT_2117769 [Clavulina sp. PMI_390]